MQWQAYIPFLYSKRVFFSILPFFVSSFLLSIISPPLFAYSSPPPCHLTRPFPFCLTQTSGCISPPPAGCMTGEQVERRANDKSLSVSPPPSISTTVQLEALLSLHPPSFQRLPFLSDRIDIQICSVHIPPSISMKLWTNQPQP